MNRLFPPLQPWDAMHPELVHLPIGILLLAPVFIVLGLIFRAHARCFFKTALIAMALGTVAVYVTVAAGQAAARLVTPTPAIRAVLHRHADLGEWLRWIFTTLTVLYLLVLYGPGWLKKKVTPRWELTMNIVFLVLYGAGALALADTADRGGMLVHEYGVRARVSAVGYPPPGATQAEIDHWIGARK